MIIEKVRIMNYRSIKDSDLVNLEEDLTLLIGRNEAGKTSILKSLEAFGTDFKYENDDLSLHSDDRKEYDYGNIYAEDIPMTTIHFQIEEYDRVKLKEIKPEFRDINTLICTKYFDNHYEIGIPELELHFKGSIDDELENEEITAYMSKIHELAESFKDELDSMLLDTAYMSFKEDYVDLIDKIIAFNEFDKIGELDYHNKLKKIIPEDKDILSQVDYFTEQVEYYRTKIKEINLESDESLDQILDVLPNFMYFSTIELLDDEATWAELKSFKDKYKTLRNLLKISDLNLEGRTDLENLDTLTDVVNASAKVTGLVNESWTQEEIDLSIYVTNTKLVVSIRDGSVNKYHKPSARSQGFQWFLSFYINFKAGSKDEFKDTIILLDDPGVYLHASGQKDLLNTLQDISGLNQIVISTHSPFMIDTDRLERIRIVSKLKSEGTIINEKFYESDFDAFAPIRASIGMTLGDSLFLNKKTLIVEGISDNILLKPMSELLAKENKGFLDTSEIAILSANSADKTKYFIAFLLSEKIDFTVLLDYDEKGKKKAKELIDRFGEDLKIITFNDLESMATGDLEIEDLIDFKFYLKAVNKVYKELFNAKLGIESLDESEFKKKSFRGIKKYFKVSEEFKRLDKVGVAKEIAKMINNGEKPDESTISNFLELFKLINEKLDIN